MEADCHTFRISNGPWFHHESPHMLYFQHLSRPVINRSQLWPNYEYSVIVAWNTAGFLLKAKENTSDLYKYLKTIKTITFDLFFYFCKIYIDRFFHSIHQCSISALCTTLRCVQFNCRRQSEQQHVIKRKLKERKKKLQLLNSNMNLFFSQSHFATRLCSICWLSLYIFTLQCVYYVRKNNTLRFLMQVYFHDFIYSI